MLSGIHHVQLTAPPQCEDAAREFYGKVLGLREIEKPPELKKRGGVWFEFGDGQQLHIGSESDFVAPRKAHPAFAVAGPSSAFGTGLDALREKLERAGYQTESDESFIGYHRFYARDPFGNRIEFVEPKSVSLLVG